MARVTFRLSLVAAPGINHPAPWVGAKLPVSGVECEVLEVAVEASGMFADVTIEAPDGLPLGALASQASASVVLATEQRSPTTMTRTCANCGLDVVFDIADLPKYGTRGVERFVHDVCPTAAPTVEQYVRIEAQVRRGSGTFRQVEDDAKAVVEFFLPRDDVVPQSEGHLRLVALAHALDALGPLLAMAAGDGRGYTTAAALSAADADLASGWQRVIDSIAFVDRVPDAQPEPVPEILRWKAFVDDDGRPRWKSMDGVSHGFGCLNDDGGGDACDDPSFPARLPRTLSEWLTLTGVRLLDADGFRDTLTGFVDPARTWVWAEFLDRLSRSQTLSLPEWVSGYLTASFNNPTS